MPAPRIIACLIACGSATLASPTSVAMDSQTESLIGRLPEISEIGYGYSAMFSGSQFLPEPDSSEVHTLVFGSQAPANSAILEGIVRRGAVAVPSLLKHLNDDRETKIPPLSGMMWTSFADEYDYNRRLRKEPPTGVNRDAFDANHPASHTITVGDLCFVALGQIVNRNFNATRYQASGGLVVSSPTCSERLCAVVRADFDGLTEKRHRDLLLQDFLAPDFEERRNGACRRIAFYYPDALEPLVLQQLAVPTFDVFKINDFVRNELYPNPSQKKRRAMFRAFLRANGQASSNGILLQLFDDLDTQEADEQHRSSRPLEEKFEPRAILVQLFGYTPAVSSTNKPYVTNWANGHLARFIKALGQDQSRKVDEAVHGIFAKVTDDDYLALACMNRLMGKGYDEEIRRYCQRRIPQNTHWAAELQEVLTLIESKGHKTTQPDGAANGSQPARR
jgi:hypothetical protein